VSFYIALVVVREDMAGYMNMAQGGALGIVQWIARPLRETWEEHIEPASSHSSHQNPDVIQVMALDGIANKHVLTLRQQSPAIFKKLR
jgi:hypothetical protein